MIKLLMLTIFAGAFICTTEAQKKRKPKKVMWHDWYDSAAFFQGPTPIIEGYGKHSNRLSQDHGGMIFYEDAGEYYRINSMADYYFWFTRRYDYLFRKSVAIYEQIYLTGNSFELARFVKENYKGKKRPAKFRFPIDASIFGTPSISEEPERPALKPRPRYLNDH